MYWSEGADKKSGSQHITEFEKEFVPGNQQTVPITSVEYHASLVDRQDGPVVCGGQQAVQCP